MTQDMYNKIMNFIKSNNPIITYKETPNELGHASMFWIEKGSTRISIKRNFIAATNPNNLHEIMPLNMLFEYEYNITSAKQNIQSKREKDNVCATLFDNILTMYNKINNQYVH